MKKNFKLLKRYAKELFKEAQTEGTKKALEDITAFGRLLKSSKELESVFVNPLFTTDERLGCLTLTAQRMGFARHSTEFLLMLIVSNAIDGLPEVIDMLTDMYFTAIKTVRVTAATAVTLDNATQEKLKGALKARLGKDVLLTTELDPSILGGLLVKIGNTIWDATIRGELKSIKDTLLKG